MPRNGPTSESIHRHWAMLRLIPRAPRKIDSATIERVLLQQGISITRRSVQRDLETLSQYFIDLRRDDRSKPYGWCWDGKSPLLEIPGMGVQSAVTFELLREHLSHVVPRATLQAMQPYFKRARAVLGQNPDAKMTRWPSKVRVVPRGLRRHSPSVSRPLLHTVYTALLEERRLSVRYKKRGAAEASDYEISPLGVVLRDGTLVLVCTFWDYEQVNQMLLHRMTTAEIVSRPADRPRGFSLDEFIASGRIGYVKGEPIKLSARVDARVALDLHEAPLSHDQKLDPCDEGWEALSATVPDTIELRTWLRGHGALIEVLEPRALREEMAAEAQAAAQLYSRP